jgi:methylated-DNA-[protein]-cysteine S-methyltransferase
MKNCDQAYQAVIRAPFGAVGIPMRGDLLLTVDPLSDPLEEDSPPVGAAARVAAMIRDYLCDLAAPLSTELLIRGSDFQLKLWGRLQQIAAGGTVTYGESAQEMGRNPCPLIPSHRVSKSGLGGFSSQLNGPQLEVKRWLLVHEGGL